MNRARPGTGVAGVAGVAAPDVLHDVGRIILLLSNVTPPLRAKSRPLTVAPVAALTEVSAITVPTNADPVSRVAELATCQKTLHSDAPPVSSTLLPEPVINVLLAWKMKTSLAPPFRVKVPPRDKAPPE